MEWGMTPYRAEVNIFHVGLRCGGQPDLLLKDQKHHIVIVDWKRVKKVSKENRYESLKYPLQHLPDCSYYRYALQVNLYRFILETEYSMPVSRMFLAICHPDIQTPRLCEIPRMEAEVMAIVDHEIENGRATTSCAPPDTPFVRE